MKTSAKGLKMDPLRGAGQWMKRILMLYVVLEVVQATLDLQLDEEQPAGTIVGDISAGLPPGITAALYFISDHEGTGVSTDLDIDESTGIIKTAKVLDRELRDRYNFIAVTMTGVTVEVTVKVNDINDHGPAFPKKHAAFRIPEQTAIGTRFPLDPAVDADGGHFTTQGYLIKDGNIGQAFTLETRRGSNEVLYLDLVVNAILDREKRSTYTLSIEGFDGGSPQRTDRMTLDITVQDINDNAPVFNQSRYHAIISENLQPGNNILQVFATDADEGDNGAVTYEINRRQSDPDRYFVVDPNTGMVALNKPLDFEMRRVHELVVQAQDNATHPEVTNAFVTIHVRDYNDNQPTMTIIFLSEDGSPQISEGAQPGQYVARISVTDPDYGEYANVNVSLEGGDGKFGLTTKDSIIYLVCVDQILDREERDVYDLRVLATDSGTPPLRAESSFTIEVTDVNDNPPLFDQTAYRQVIPEVVFPGSFVLQVTARDRDQGPNGDITYSILRDKGVFADWFSIDAVTGIITTLSQLDYEKNPNPSITVVATDAGKPPLSSTAVVNVVLQDNNDNEPVFENNFYNVSVNEDVAPGTCILEVQATDADGGSFGSISYSLNPSLNGAVTSQFTIDKETGVICTRAALDRDQGQSSYDFTVTAVDGGGLSTLAYVKVDLLDVNDNRPAFYPLSYAVSLSSQSAPGTSVVRVIAKDADAGENGRITYRTVSGGSSPYFTLNKDTGVISLSRSVHGKANTVIPMVISAQDGGGLTAPVNAKVNISVVAGAVAPPVFEQTHYYFTVPEDVLQGTVVGNVLAKSKTGSPRDMAYTISSGDPTGYFTVDPDTGTLRTSLSLDHEAQPTLDLEVQVRTGNPPAFGQTRVHVTVEDVNDNPPVFLPSSSESLMLPEQTEMGTVVYRVQAEDRDSGVNGQLSFDLSSTSENQRAFSIERNSGEIRLVGALNYESIPRYDLQVIAKDAGVPQLSATFMLVVHVQAENNQGPVFDTLSYRVELKEGTPINTRFLRVRALNRESTGSGYFSSLSYHLRPDSDAASFAIASDSGWLFVKSALDREVKDMYLLTVLASAGDGQLKKTGSATVRISVTDENDNPPRLTRARIFMTVRENLPAGTGFGHVLATDRDSGSNGRISYRLLHSDRNFQINSHTGEMSTRATLDREQQSSYQLAVVVQDGGSPSRSATGTVFISVLDDNDNTPVFVNSHLGKKLILQVSEGQSSGVLLGTVQAKDPDEGENGTVIYSLSGPRAERFFLNPNTGELHSSSPLSHSERPEYALTVTASDRGLPPRSASCSLAVQVLSTSRPSSKTNSHSIAFNSVEEAEPGSVVGSVRLHDVETQGEVTYMVVGGTDKDGTFVVDRSTGDVYLAKPLDYEQDAHYALKIEVDDFSRDPPVSTLVYLDINVNDSNDHAPEFPEDPVTIVISESVRPGASVFTFQATDKDGSGPNSELRYSIVRQFPDVPGLLTLDPSTGVLTLNRELDHEIDPSLVLVVKATDSALDHNARQWSSVTARIYVTDENDNPPVFSSPTAVSVMEDQPVGFVALYVMARDADKGENGRVTYRIQSGNTGGSFSLNPNTGSLSIFKTLDREEQEVFNLTVVAEDHGTPRHSTTQLLRVYVVDVNDEAPRFEESSYEAQIAENQPRGSAVLTVSAFDLDQGSNGKVTYDGLSVEGFTINPVTGVITTTQPLDREQQEYYTVTVYAKDGGLPPNYAKATVKIRVLDENDNAPIFGRLYYGIEVPENLESRVLFTLRATDRDSGDGGKINYQITDGDPAGDFHLDRQSGALSTSGPLDRENTARYTLTVTAQDQARPSRSSTATVEVTIMDMNDHSPQFTTSSYTADVSEDVPIGSLVLDVKATDLDEGPNSQVVYFLSQGSKSMFIIDQNMGRIITAAPLDRERTASYTFDVCATDSSPSNPRNSTARVTVHIQDVNDNAPFFIQDPLILNISAGSLSNQRVLATMRAEDKDFGANGSVFYRFAHSVRGFTINSLTGAIQATENLQGLTQSQRTLIVQAMDQGNPAQSSLGVVIVYIKEQMYRGIRFSRAARDVSLQENAAKGTVVTQTQAQYPDGSQNGVIYSLFSGNQLQSFGINTITGEIWVQKSEGLDYEETPKLRLVVKAETASSSSYMAVNLILQDVNDNLPRFQLQNYVAYIREAQGHDFPIIQVAADDLDQGQNGQVTYSIRSSSMSGLFKIDPMTGSISTTAIMDREIWTQTKLVVTATDRGSPRLAGSATLTVIIIDLNDNSPMIPLPREIRVPEDTLIGTVISQVTGNDVDSGPALSYTLYLDGDSKGMFGIHCFGGGVALTRALDYEERTWYTLTIRSSDSKHQSEANLTVLVEDVNDNAPAFTQDLYQVTVSEHLPEGSALITVTATDSDSGDNGKITYKVMSSTRGFFSIDPSNGTLFVKQKTEFNFENPSILVVVEARDQGTPSLSSVATIQVQVSDINDNAPVFHQSEYRATVSEDELPGSTVLTLEAADGDLSRDNSGFDFAIASGNSGNAFQIESSVRFLEGRGFQTVGSLILVEELDFEAVSSYNLTVVVSDRGIPQRSSCVPILISIKDVNDNPPAFSRGEYSVVLSESAAAGTEVLHLSATDPDSAPNGEVHYSISSGDKTSLFQVDQWTGALKLQRPLSTEKQLTHMIVVQATDGLGKYAFAPVSIDVKDINDHRPFFPLSQVTASIRENQPKNALVTMLHAIDHDKGVFGKLRYYLLEDSQDGKELFFINQTSGEVRTRSTFDFEKVESFNFMVAAMDSGNYSATVTVQVYVSGEDEYDPVFTSPEYSFKVPEDAKEGQIIGRVQAKDEDGGLDGIVLYSLSGNSPYFEVNQSTGAVSLKMDSYSRHVSRSKREVRLMTLGLTAHSPLENSRTAAVKVTVDVSHTSFGLATDMNLLLVSVIAVSLGTIVILCIIAVALFFVKLRRQRKEQKRHRRTKASATMLHKFEETKIATNEIIYHQALPGFAADQSSGSSSSGGPYTRGGSLDPSHSSGRGSAEAEAAEDDEIRMINEYPRVSSISSSMQERMSARGPDSGIQQDADQLSDVSCEPSIDWFKGKKMGSLNSTLLAGQVPIYRDDGGGYVGVGRSLSVSNHKDYTFPEDGKPAVDGSLTAIVASDEELRGSYNWDYLLNWCPQFQPLASVFTEIARLKDETAPAHPRRSFHRKCKESRIDPPPLITSVAHPGAKTVPPKPAAGRTFPHLSTFRRSPLSSEGSICSAAMSPSFSPSLSPLAARSPAVTPFSVSQGPSASVISTTEHNLENIDEAELRI
ncbi:protocadherin-16-like [Corythoichthys intestinalis]|uniref:protocadherin-16-like n=1 Tax=Corythoichthys intestinalis TaxID=161448 RepID=UPI0025A54083|nr:protocadherin-16-like [Corythoichthys intestinalis]XP_061811947.1 protocadherin-16-like [Nerophis lumbriciformis]